MHLKTGNGDKMINEWEIFKQEIDKLQKEKIGVLECYGDLQK